MIASIAFLEAVFSGRQVHLSIPDFIEETSSSDGVQYLLPGEESNEKFVNAGE